MTISSTLRKAGPYVGNGVATAFDFAFKIFTASDLVVTLLDIASGTETTLTLTTDYTVTLNADQNTNPGGTVTYNPSGTPMASTHTLTITSGVAQTQGTDIPNAGGFYPEVVENALDKAVILVQQLAEVLNRTFRLPVSTAISAVLPPPVTGGAGFGWNAAGTAIVNYVFQAGTSLVDLAANSGSALIGFIAAGVNAVHRTVQARLRDYCEATDYDTLQHAADAAALLGTALHIPGSVTPYQQTIALTAAHDGITIYGDGPCELQYSGGGALLPRIGTLLLAPDNTTSVISVGAGCNNVYLEKMGIHCVPVANGGPGNAGSHYGIYYYGASYARLFNLIVSGFNTNIRMSQSSVCEVDDVHSHSAVFGDVGTGHGFHMSGTPVAPAIGAWLRNSHFNTNAKDGLRFEDVESPVLQGIEALLNAEYGLISESTNAGVHTSTGPFCSDSFFDSNGVHSVVIIDQWACKFSNVWVSAMDKTATSWGWAGGDGLYLDGVLQSSFDVTAMNCAGSGVGMAPNCYFNSFRGYSSNNLYGVYMNTGCRRNTFAGFQATGNKRSGFKSVNTSAQEPNNFMGSLASGNNTSSGGYNNYDITTTDIPPNPLNATLQFGKNAIANGAGGTTLVLHSTGAIAEYTVPLAGSIMCLSIAADTTVTGGTFDVQVRVNGVPVTETLCRLENVAGHEQYRTVNIVSRGIAPLAAGDVISVIYGASAGFTSTSGSLNVAAVVALELQGGQQI